MYQTQERADANFGESYFGGDAADYDVMKPEKGQAYEVIATDGNADAYTELWQQAATRADDGVTPNFINDEAYLEAQGKNPDGTRNTDYPVLLDVDNLIVYMMEILRSGNFDAPISAFLGGNVKTNNFFAIRDRTGDEGFLNAIDDLATDYLPDRNDYVLEQFRNTTLALRPNSSSSEYTNIVPAPLFPDVDAPIFQIDGVAQHGGEVTTSSTLSFDSPAGRVYYMTDGSDLDFSAELELTTQAIASGIPITQSIDLVAWALSTDGTWSALQQAAFSTTTSLADASHLRITDFNPNPTNPGSDDFALSASSGDEVYLTQAVGGEVSRFEAVVQFGSIDR